ncbi:phage holin family protein [Serratia marcescens]|uniref:phage holin family protein n=1 Tax=Serratia marcescens TaxID=615 RepID=UPI00320472CD
MELPKLLLPEVLLWLKENKTALGYALSGGTMAVLRCIYHGESFKITCVEGGMCAMAAFGISEMLMAMEWHPDLAFPASVFLGYIGIASALRFVRLKTDDKKRP